jgi:hypothetical protein
MDLPSSSHKTMLGALPVAIFGIDNSGIGVFANLLVIFLIAIWLALVFWTYADARRRLEDGVLIGSATLAAIIFPFAGSLIYAIVRPPETLDDAYERDLDVRAAELRVRLLEGAVKGGPGTSQHSAALAGEVQGEAASGRRSAAPPSSGSGPRRTPDSERPGSSRQQQGSGGRAPSQPSRQSPGSDPSRPRSSPEGQPQRPSSGNPSSSRPPIAGSDGA